MKKGLLVFIGILGISLLAGMNVNASQQALLDEVKDSTKVVVEEKVIPETSIVDEVIWVVGDEPILKSDVEAMRLQAEAEGVRWQGDPDCTIPEQMAVQKLFLHQAAIDSLEVSESEVSQGIDDQINRWIQLIGSQEKLEEYRKQTVQQMRQEMHDDFKNTRLVQKMREKLVEDVNVTPADVRLFFKDLSEDSIPFVPTEVEVEILTQEPRIPAEEINRVKDQLREYTDRVTKGETTFATLARMYSEDPVSARQGGELGYTGRGLLDPAFASVAFNLTDPKKISKIVETEFGYHIIQLIDKRGDKVNVRHILLKPRASYEVIDQAIARLDSIGDDIRAGKFPFEEGASVLSDDKDTKNNRGLMSNFIEETRTRTSKFQMKDLPTEIARVVDTMKVGEVSKAFKMINNKGKTTCAIVKLRSRVEGHKATITEDFQVMKDVVLAQRREEVLHEWVVEKIKHTYVRMNERYKDCKFEYQGWVK
ncbi:MAG: peptidylprolyl isomerase [Prevotella sp.]|nr:peptidylprolyl isomerase [Prevotella sp.]